VTFYQWALRDSPSAIVLSIVATTPLAVMALAFVFEKTRPSPRAVVGSLLAVAGVVALVFSLY
jgi:drug/metabolite transporter (DMT)-like permease